MSRNHDLVVGLALGSGSSRGFAHIGIIKELVENGVIPQVVCGTSVGALIAASWVTGTMDDLENWARQLTKFRMARFLDINARFAGFIDENRFNKFLDQYVANDNVLIEDCRPTYGAISTELMTARERWLTKGSLKEAVWASMSLPGLFPPRRYEGEWHVDGGLVNPVPISLCHALGANFVIAVNLNGDIVGKHLVRMEKAETTQNAAEGSPEASVSFTQRLSNLTREYAGSLLPATENTAEQTPSVINTVAAAVNITQDRITRSRMAGDPPDILLVPRLAQIGLLELYRAPEAIEEGRQCVQRMLSEIERMVK